MTRSVLAHRTIADWMRVTSSRTIFVLVMSSSGYAEHSRKNSGFLPFVRKRALGFVYDLCLRQDTDFGHDGEPPRLIHQ